MSNGTLQQLASKGVQDGHLNIAPETSFFKRTYKRVSNYAIEAIDMNISSFQWGRSYNTIMSRNGDLASEMWLYVNIELLNLATPGPDTVRWTNVLGHAMIKACGLFIGSNRIDYVVDQYLEIIHETQSDVNVNVDELVLRSDNEAQLIEWANNGNTLDTDGNAIVQLYVQLPFWFTRARSQSLPVIALQYHDIRMQIELRSKDELVVYSNAANTTLATGFEGDIIDGSYLVDFVFLDSMERRLFASNAHEYLIKNIQISDHETKSAGATKKQINVVFNHPCTVFYWFVQRQSILDALDYFNYERSPGLGDDTITSAVIKFNGSEREKPRGPLYYRVVLSALYFPRTPRKNLYLFSFAQHPTAWFPSGSVNLSRIDVTSLELTFPATDAFGAEFGLARLYVLTENFNVLRIQGGQFNQASVKQAKVWLNVARSGDVLKPLAKCRREIFVSRTEVTPLPIIC